MIFRILVRSLAGRWSRKLLAILTVWIGLSLVVALLTLGLDVGDKMNRELSAFGANIRVEPSTIAVPVRVGGYDLSPAVGQGYLEEAQIANLDDIFWRNNILSVVPRLWTQAQVVGQDMPLLGVGASHEVSAGRDVPFVEGTPKMYAHWRVDGGWPQTENECLVGADAAHRLDLSPGNRVKLSVGSRSRSFLVTGVVRSGQREDDAFIVPLHTAKHLVGLPGKISEVDVSALTTPENELVKKYRLDPTSLSPAEYERWSCTPYPGSVAAQIQGAIKGSAARVVRRVSETQGAVLNRMEGLMGVLGGLTVAVSCLSVIGVLASAILQRRTEVALLQALGAHRGDVVLLFSCEAVALGLLGGALAAVTGPLLGRWLVHAVFGGEAGSPAVFAIVSPLLGSVVTWLACLWPVSQVLHENSAHVLHGN